MRHRFGRTGAQGKARVHAGEVSQVLSSFSQACLFFHSHPHPIVTEFFSKPDRFPWTGPARPARSCSVQKIILPTPPSPQVVKYRWM